LPAGICCDDAEELAELDELDELEFDENELFGNARLGCCCC